MATTALWPTGTTGRPYGGFSGKTLNTATEGPAIPAQSYAAIYRRSRFVWLAFALGEIVRRWFT